MLKHLIAISGNKPLDKVLEIAVQESALSPYIPDTIRIKKAARKLPDLQP
jgi:hypothetical protein